MVIPVMFPWNRTVFRLPRRGSPPNTLIIMMKASTGVRTVPLLCLGISEEHFFSYPLYSHHVT
jgi:hypothetical protein